MTKRVNFTVYNEEKKTKEGENLFRRQLKKINWKEKVKRTILKGFGIKGKEG